MLCVLFDTLEAFFRREYGLTRDDILQVHEDVQREYKEWEEALPKCCCDPDWQGGRCQHCGADMIDVPGLWEVWACADCGEEELTASEDECSCVERECRYAQKYSCPYPDRHLKTYGCPAPDRR